MWRKVFVKALPTTADCLADKFLFIGEIYYKKNGPALARLMHESDHKRFLPMSCHSAATLWLSAAHGMLGFRAGDQQQREPYQPRCLCT